MYEQRPYTGADRPEVYEQRPYKSGRFGETVGKTGLSVRDRTENRLDCGNSPNDSELNREKRYWETKTDRYNYAPNRFAKRPTKRPPYQTGPGDGMPKPKHKPGDPLKPWHCGFHGGTKKDGTPCTMTIRQGRKRCKMHGGNAPRGPDNPAFRHGRYSRVMPENIAARFEESLADPEILSLRREVALLSHRAEQVTEAALAGAPPLARWLELRKLWAEFQAAAKRGGDDDAQAAAAALDAVGAAIGRAAETEKAWVEVGKWTDALAKMGNREWRRMVDLQAVLTLEQARGVFVQIQEILRRHVSDPRTLAAIGSDLGRLISL